MAIEIIVTKQVTIVGLSAVHRESEQYKVQGASVGIIGNQAFSWGDVSWLYLQDL